MKVRWTTESIRFRITPGELEQLRQGDGVHLSLLVPGGRWEVTIQPGSGDTPTMLCGNAEGGMTLSLAPIDLAALCEAEREGIYFSTTVEGIPLRYFIEKDFPCVHPRPVEAQEKSDTFSPPPGFADRHRTKSC